MKTTIALALILLAGFTSASWDTLIGQSVLDTAGTGACTNTFYTGEDCGFFLIGILTFLAFVTYMMAVGLSSEAMVPLSGLLLMFLSTRGFMPAAIGFGVVIIAGLLIYKGLSQVPNG